MLAAAPAAADAEQAMRAFKAGKYVEASAMYQALVDESPGSAYGYYMLGNCLLKMREPVHAERSFRDAIARNGERFEYHHGLANALLAQGSYAEAIDALSAAEPLVQRQQRFAFHALRGACLGAIKQWQQAARDLEIAATLRPEKVVLDQLGKAEAALGRYDRAAQALRVSAARDPSDAGVQRLLAESLVRVAPRIVDPLAKRALYVEAVRAAEAVVAASPSAEGVDLLGRASLGAADYERAVRAFRAVLEADPGNCLARLNLASAEIGAKLLAQAETSLHEAKRCPQTAANAYLRLGWLYLARGRPREALDAYQRSEGIEPTGAARAGIVEARARIARSAGETPASVRR
jgi:tetratricopeptide (TPR) repeat protein